MSVCARCGRDDGEPKATIGDDEYCHAFMSAGPTCYMLESWERNTGTGEAELLQELIDAMKDL